MGGFEVVTIHGLTPSARRGVVFLESQDHDELDAAATFDGLKESVRRKVLDRMDYWIAGGINDNYFHGWPNDSANKECFAFKWNYQREHHRLYGFLYHPLPRLNPPFLLCVLVSHAVKNSWNTDPDELACANRLRVDPHVRAAISMVFPDEKNPCLN